MYIIIISYPPLLSSIFPLCISFYSLSTKKKKSHLDSFTTSTNQSTDLHLDPCVCVFLGNTGSEVVANLGDFWGNSPANWEFNKEYSLVSDFAENSLGS